MTPSSPELKDFNTRPLVDVGIDMTNRIEESDIQTVMIKTFADIEAVLSDHCGPYGQFAMLVDPRNKIAEPVFTKDGIGIVRAMEYMSPMQEFVRSTIAYMGSRIETAAGDGTTSSMIILARGLRYLLEQLKCTRWHYTYSDFQKIYEQFAADVVDELNRSAIKLTPDAENWKELVYHAAYSQVYTSSHGDKNLAHAIAVMFSETPYEAWDYMYIDKCNLESDKLYTIEEDVSQYSIQNIRIWPESAKTEDFGISRIRKNARTILSGVAPGRGFVAQETLLNEIIRSISGNESLTVICPRSIDSETQFAIEEAFKKNPDHDVCLFLMDDDDPRLNDIVCMKMLANARDMISECNLDYEYKKGDLKVTAGLYDSDPSAQLNPNFGKPEYSGLNDLVKQLDNIILQLKNEVSNRNTNHALKRLQKLRLKLTVQKRTYFLIGGSAYDNAASVDIVIDAMLATKNSLKKGFVLGGNKTLYTILKNIDESLSTVKKFPSVKLNELYQNYVNMFVQGITTVHTAILSKLGIQPDSIYMHHSYDVTLCETDDGCSFRMDKMHTLAMIASGQVEHGIIEPVQTDIELVKRFGELVLKFVSTKRIIAIGGMCKASHTELVPTK